MKKPVLIFSMLLAVHQLVLAQEAPNILPPSPQSQELFKHFEFPEGNASGTINYSVPVYEVKSGSLSLPISVSYVSGGSKLSDQPGEVGYNWSLNAGGRISRTIYGKPDEYSSFPSSIENINSSMDPSANYSYLTYIYNSTYIEDSQFDIYSYSFGNNSGKFIYNPYDAQYHTIPVQPHRISGVVDGVGPTWTIVDDKGITYKYGTVEQYTSTGPNYGHISSRLLNYIISADKRDTITITYQTLAPQVATTTGAMTTVNDNNTSNWIGTLMQLSPDPFTLNQTVSQANNYIVSTVSEITSRSGKVTFTTNSANNAVEYIKVFDKKNNLVKQLQLVNTGGHLGELRFKDVSGANVEKYAFEYYPRPTTYYLNEDFYGYLKQGGGVVPARTVGYSYHLPGEYSFSIDNTEYNGEFSTNYPVDYSSSSDAIAGMLKKVTFPTGGISEYSYETNKVFYGGGAVNSGGMRLKEVKLTDNNGNVHYKTYTYGTNEDGLGNTKHVPVSPTTGPPDQYFSYENRVFPWLGGNLVSPDLQHSSYRKRFFTSSILPEVAEAAQEATAYSQVTIYDGTLSSNTGKTVYTYDFGGPRYQVNPYPDSEYGVYGLAEPLLDAYDPSAGREVRFPIANPTSNGRSHISEFNLWYGYPLQSTTVYKKTGSGYDPVKSIVNEYNHVQTNSFKGLHILSFVQTNDAFRAVTDFKLPVYLYDNYVVTTGHEDLVSTTETLYTPAGNVVTTTSYEYNSNNQVSKVTRAESGGDSKITTYKYAADQGTTEPYRSMVIKNMLAPVIEEATYKNAVNSGNFLQSTRTDYAFWANNIAVAKTPGVDPDPNPIYPERVWTHKNNPSNSDLRLWYKSYGMYDGNVQEVYAKWPGPATSYIWGYNRQYPIAQAINSSVNNIFHENFEEGTGNSTYNNSRTGHYSKTDAYTKALTGLANGKYTLRYWKKTGGIWTMQTSSVTLTGAAYTISIAVSAGELLDDICFYPESAQMVTLTYDPLIGTTSTTDNQGITTYYEYDNYQRLMNVRDKDGKIVKHMDYQYKQ